MITLTSSQRARLIAALPENFFEKYKSATKSEKMECQKRFAIIWTSFRKEQTEESLFTIISASISNLSINNNTFLQQHSF